jgi:tetratricopeptide (TPR) repeat protein
MSKESSGTNHPVEHFPLPVNSPEGKWSTILYALIVILILAGIGLIFGGRVLYRQVRDYRARKTVEVAKKELADENWQAAFLSVQDAMKISPDEPEVLRIAARLLLKTRGDPAAMRQILHRLVTQPRATTEDRVFYGEALLLSGDAGKAKEVFEALDADEKTGRHGLELLAKVQDSEGDQALALSTLRKALTLDLNDTSCRLRLAMLDLDLPFDETRRAALERIRVISKGKDDAALQAIMYLSSQTNLTPSDAEDLRLTVAKHPKSEDKHRLMVLSSYIKIFPNKKKALIDEECAKYKGKGIEDMVQLLRWLGNEGEMNRILGLVPKSLVSKSASAFPIYAEALMGAEKWADLKAVILSSPAPMISQASAHALLAQCASKLEKDLTETKHQIGNAYRAAAKFGEMQVIARCADMAEGLGLWELASEGYAMIEEKNPRNRVLMLTKMYEMAALRKDGKGMLDAAQRLVEAKPEGWMNRARVDYLRLLLGTQFEEASVSLSKVEVSKVFLSSPEAKSYLAILRSLSAFRLGDYRLAKAELQEVTQPASLPVGVRAVMAGLVSKLDDNPTEAFRMAESIPSALLLDEELRFLKMAL